MMWLKACPRCHGDLYLDADISGSFIVCVQCGHNLTPLEEATLRLTGAMARPLRPVRVVVRRFSGRAA